MSRLRAHDLQHDAAVSPKKNTDPHVAGLCRGRVGAGSLGLRSPFPHRRLPEPHPARNSPAPSETPSQTSHRTPGAALARPPTGLTALWPVPITGSSRDRRPGLIASCPPTAGTTPVTRETLEGRSLACSLSDGPARPSGRQHLLYGAQWTPSGGTDLTRAGRRARTHATWRVGEGRRAGGAARAPKDRPSGHAGQGRGRKDHSDGQWPGPAGWAGTGPGHPPTATLGRRWSRSGKRRTGGGRGRAVVLAGGGGDGPREGHNEASGRGQEMPGEETGAPADRQWPHGAEGTDEEPRPQQREGAGPQHSARHPPGPERDPGTGTVFRCAHRGSRRSRREERALRAAPHV